LLGLCRVAAALVIVVGGFVFLLGLPGYREHGEHGRIGAARSQISNFETAIDLFEADTGRLPALLDDLRVAPAGVPGWKGPYLKKDLPLDPWGNPYRYALRHSPEGTRRFVLSSDGSDGLPDTADDVTNLPPGDRVRQ
jgi:general secretion pathway protein G